MLLLTLLFEGRHLAHRRVLWFVENTAALSGVVKGTSRHPVLEKLIGLFWILAYRLQIEIWVEYVESDANWSDGISRELSMDTFSMEHGFRLRELIFTLPEWLQRSYAEMWAASRLWEDLPCVPYKGPSEW